MNEYISIREEEIIIADFKSAGGHTLTNYTVVFSIYNDVIALLKEKAMMVIFIIDNKGNLEEDEDFQSRIAGNFVTIDETSTGLEYVTSQEELEALIDLL